VKQPRPLRYCISFGMEFCSTIYPHCRCKADFTSAGSAQSHFPLTGFLIDGTLLRALVDEAGAGCRR
jgi:hypothetical protein